MGYQDGLIKISREKNKIKSSYDNLKYKLK